MDGGRLNNAYPFTAVVGLDDLKLALLLNAVSPRVGGVLVRGEKGTAKSTGWLTSWSNPATVRGSAHSHAAHGGLPAIGEAEMRSLKQAEGRGFRESISPPRRTPTASWNAPGA
ncbi:hypothetical protein E1287_15825 [Actinomadura sp. KC06]|uniref:hypothetical protein n=1 Tax=Actinomadura sp. KC06 TaxID=2530369 RepID=UPI001050BF57|nr:hypothetical protein [Actinomadura sp. KC06]TDD34662.1 hypothetical protein E1287_15825 [Actinomadura sp. KC06]